MERDEKTKQPDQNNRFVVDAKYLKITKKKGNATKGQKQTTQKDHYQ